MGTGLMTMAILMVMCIESSFEQQSHSGGALLVVYPDYPINTDTFYGYTELAGHAGALLISKDGLTKYFEYGRYDDANLGRVRNVKVSNVRIENGIATRESLLRVLRELSIASGKNGRIRAAYFVNMDFEKMRKAAVKELRASDPGDSEFDLNRKRYDILINNCGHFAERVILAGNPNVDRPVIINPTPNNIVDEYIEESNAEVNFDPATASITIGQGDESDAKK